MGEHPDKTHQARRFALRFRRGRPQGFDLLEGEDLIAALGRHLEFFPGEALEALEERFCDPTHLRGFRYGEREELLSLAKEMFPNREGG